MTVQSGYGKFARKLGALAKICQMELDDEIIDMYADALEPLGWPMACGAVSIVFETAGPGKFPSIAQLRQALTGHQPNEVKATDRDESKRVVDRIVVAMGRQSLQRRQGGKLIEEPLREFLGELGWLVVEARGGWDMLKANLVVSRDGMIKDYALKDLQDSATAILSAQRRGVLDRPPALPEPGRVRVDLRPISANDTAGLVSHLDLKKDGSAD